MSINPFKVGQWVQVRKECLNDGNPWLKDYFDTGPFLIKHIEDNILFLYLSDEQYKTLKIYDGSTSGSADSIYFSFLEELSVYIKFEKFYDEII